MAEGFNRMLDGLRDREVIRETFGKYVTREVRDEILAGRASVEGRIEEVTMLFADLRDFTPRVERTEPREVVRDLNEYFTEMEAAIRGERGLVLQYIGDEIEAVFGAPLRAPDHADRALAAAREIPSMRRPIRYGERLVKSEEECRDDARRSAHKPWSCTAISLCSISGRPSRPWP